MGTVPPERAPKLMERVQEAFKGERKRTGSPSSHVAAGVGPRATGDRDRQRLGHNAAADGRRKMGDRSNVGGRTVSWTYEPCIRRHAP